MQVLDQPGLTLKRELHAANPPVHVGFHLAQIGGPLGGFERALAAVGKYASSHSGVRHRRQVGFLVKIGTGFDQHLNFLGDAESVATRQTAPFGRLLTIVGLVQPESDEFVLLYGLGDAGKLTNGGPTQRGGAVEGRVEGGNLLRGHRPNVFRGKIHGLVAEIETQPLALALVDVNVFGEQIEEFLGFVHHARELVERNPHAASA